MCGIAGVIGARATERVKQMLPLMLHRGPDGEGIWSPEKDIAFGHRRLAINDLSAAGAQPMVSVENNLAIAVNGEIYNYPELRKELELKGAIFRSNSDSEVVIHAWQHWGRDCFERFNGMFAIAIYDCIQKVLILARDRLGIKPLYYTETKNGLVFASEIKSLLTGLDESLPGIDPVGLNQYLTYQNYFGERTLREGIKLLRPGHSLTFKPGLSSKVQSYWSLSFTTENSDIDFSTAVERYKDTLESSVRRHLLSDVPVASYLSAGFDSATVANRAAVIGQPPVCFTGRFTEGGWYDETSMAAEMARHNGSEHIAVSISSGDLSRVMDDLISTLDEPRMGMGSFPQYCVAEQVAKTHKVILTGHGGDELFSGYPVFKLVQFMNNFKHNPINAFKQIGSFRATELPHLAYFGLSSFKPRAYRQFLPVLNSSSVLQHGLKPEWAELIRDKVVDDELLALDSACSDQMQVLYSHYLQAYLNGLLVVEDKISMAHSLESRTPILDNAMLDLSLSLPQHIKLHQGNLKAVIKEGGRDWLPNTLYQQPKRGFPTPLRFWLRGPLKEWYVNRITGSDSGLRKLFKDDWLKQTCQNYLSSPRQKFRPLDEIQSHRMWQLLSLESWLRTTQV